MKKINFLYSLIIAVLLVTGCSSDDSSSTESGNVKADFSFTNNGSEFTFTNLSEGATSYKWDFGDLYFYSYEKDPVYSYDIVGGELTVSLIATNDAGEESFMSKSIVAPIVINADITIDGDFEDWEEVPVSNEFPEVNFTIKKMKFYTKGPLIHIYFEGGTNMELPVIDLVFNTDGDRATGYTDNWGIGGDYLYEGPPVIPGWGSFYSHSGVGNGFSWNAIVSPDFMASGVVAIDGDTNAVEFSIPKSFFGTLGDTIDFGMFISYGAEIYPDPSGEPIIIEL